MGEDETGRGPGPGATPAATAAGGIGGTVSAVAGTATALAMLGGVIWWGHDLATREARSVPVIAATVTPAKTVPEDAGGRAEAHTDVTSYRLSHGGADEDVSGYAPLPRPPREEDLSLGALEEMLQEAQAETARDADPAETEELATPGRRTVPEAEDGSADAADGDAGTEETELAALDPSIPAPLPRPGDVVRGEGEAETGAATEAEAEPEARGPTPPEGTGSRLAPAIAPVAQGRPPALLERVAVARAEAATDAVRLGEAAAAAPYQLQLGAFGTEARTRSEWARIADAHPELLNSRALVVQPTRSGGQTLYRLRVGPFTSLAEAASLCEALRARGQTCIPAESR